MSTDKGIKTIGQLRYVLVQKVFQGMAYNVTGWRSADNSNPSRPATEVDYLIDVQVIEICRLHSCPNNSSNKEPKVDERFSFARIFANLHVGRPF